MAFKCIPYPKFFLQTLFKENLGLIFGFPYQFNGRVRLTVVSVLQLFICKLLFICSLADVESQEISREDPIFLAFNFKIYILFIYIFCGYLILAP